MSEDAVDLVWRALADPTRRAVLDVLADGPRMTGELVDQLGDMAGVGGCRTNVMKHLDVLVEAGLVIVRREGRVRWNHLNPVPIQQVCDRWVSRHVRGMASAMARLKEHVESPVRTSAWPRPLKKQTGRKPKTRKGAQS